MSIISSLLKSVVNPMSLAQLAMGPAGWASIAMKAIGSAVAQQLIQKLGQQLGLPQQVIDLAQAAFAASSGQPGLVKQNIGQAVEGVTSQFDLRHSEKGALQRELMGAADKSLDNLSKIVDEFTSKLGKKKPSIGGEEDEGGSWLVALAKAMGKVMDKKAAQMKEKSDEVSFYADQSVSKDKTGLDAKSTQNQNKLSSATALLQAYGQEMSYISSATTNVMKSVGEAQTTLARK